MVFLSKLLPLFVYPLGLACLLLVAALLAIRYKQKPAILVAAALLLLWLFGNKAVAYTLARSLEWRYPPLSETPQADVIVVLGGGTASKGYPRLYVELEGAGDRVLYAYRLYSQGAAPIILLSGGNIGWEDEAGTPASEMAEILELIGVPRQALWLEDLSQNTAENAEFSAQILKEKGAERVILVTSAMHMRRAVYQFNQQGVDVIPAPTDFTFTDRDYYQLLHGSIENRIIALLPNTSSLSLSTNVMKEYLGISVARVSDWLTAR